VRLDGCLILYLSAPLVLRFLGGLGVMPPQHPLGESPKRLPIGTNHVVHIRSETHIISLVLALPSVVYTAMQSRSKTRGRTRETGVLQEERESLARDGRSFVTCGGVTAYEVGGRGEAAGREELECFAGLES
jgi:hypothetical protein